jgi:hypothetical protein
VRSTLARAGPVLAAAGLVLLALSGCSSKPPAADGPGGGAHHAEATADGGLGSFNVTTPHPGGASSTHDYAGVAKDDPQALQGVPTGLARGPFQSCCDFTWVAAPDLFVADQFAALRVRLDWTNTQTDSANLDVAVCVPWYCGFDEQPDQTDQVGAQSETMDLVSGGHRQFLDNGFVPQVGVRYSNLVSANGVPFTIHAEVVPVADSYAVLDPYEVVVPANATLSAELVAPFRAEASAGVMVYGADDRPRSYTALSGANGTRTALLEGPGSFVVVPFAYDGALVRLHVDNATAAPKPARHLEETFGTVTVAAVADPAPHEGTFSFDAPPGSMDTFPYFLYDSAAAQYRGVTPGSMISLTSSTGLIASVDLAAVGAVTPIGQTCFTCNTMVDWTPEHFLDDDGSYQVAYNSGGATGTFVLFTATYSR